MKCIVDFANNTCLEAKRLNPKIKIIARTLTTDNGVQDCPNKEEYEQPKLFFDHIKNHLPKGYDFYEIQNECPPSPQGWSYWAYWSIEVAKLVNQYYNAPMLGFSFGPGNPEISHWSELLPYFKWVAENPISGQYNGIAVHSSVYMSGPVPSTAVWVSNVWVAGRETEVAFYLWAHDRFDYKSWPGQTVITEVGLNDGYSGDWSLQSWSCAQLKDTYQTSIQVWQEQGIVDAFTWWNLGKIGKWSDNSNCIGVMVK